MYQMKMLSHIWGQTNQQTNRLNDQLLELLEWLFATKNMKLKPCFTAASYFILSLNNIYTNYKHRSGDHQSTDKIHEEDIIREKSDNTVDRIPFLFPEGLSDFIWLYFFLVLGLHITNLFTFTITYLLQNDFWIYHGHITVIFFKMKMFKEWSKSLQDFVMHLGPDLHSWFLFGHYIHFQIIFELISF